MALYLIACVYDEGVYENNFRVVEAASRESVARHILANYELFADYLERSVFYKWLDCDEAGPKKIWEQMGRVILNSDDGEKLNNLFRTWFSGLTANELLKWIDWTSVDGDSRAQLTIHEITEIVKVSSE